MSWSVNHYKRKMEKKCNWNRLCKKNPGLTNVCDLQVTHTGIPLVECTLRNGSATVCSVLRHQSITTSCILSAAQRSTGGQLELQVPWSDVMLSFRCLCSIWPIVIVRHLPFFFFCDYLMSPDHCLFLCNGFIRIPTHFHFTIPYFSRTNSQLYK